MRCFALGSRGAAKGDAAALFDRVFAAQRETLEAAFVAWIADPR